MQKRIGIGIVAAVLCGLSVSAAALKADEVRGGWIADTDGQREVYLLNVRGTVISGIYCWDCSNPENLAFVLDGKLEEDGFSFVLLHDTGPGAPYRDSVKRRIVDGRLVRPAHRQKSAASERQMPMLREPRRPARLAHHRH